MIKSAFDSIYSIVEVYSVQYVMKLKAKSNLGMNGMIKIVPVCDTVNIKLSFMNFSCVRSCDYVSSTLQDCVSV